MIADLGREYPVFKKYLSLKFVPFGRANSLDANGNSFECHHGPKECVANKLQSCVLKHLDGRQNAQQQFVVCQMRKEAEVTGKECAEEAGADWSEITKCVDGDEGKKLQLSAERDTKALGRLKNVPTVVFNNVSSVFSALSFIMNGFKTGFIFRRYSTKRCKTKPLKV